MLPPSLIVFFSGNYHRVGSSWAFAHLNAWQEILQILDSLHTRNPPGYTYSRYLSLMHSENPWYFSLSIVEIPQLGGIHRTRPGINRIYTLLTFGQNSRHSLLWKNQIITFLDMSQIISIVCFICKWWRWYLSLCWLNIVLSNLFFQMLFHHGRVQMFAQLNKTTSGLQTTKR